jgi:WhiB family redox-sensing transcriptional regulator
MASDWRQHGNCAKGDPDRFFTEGQVSKDVQEACRTCPVLVPCTFDALRPTSGRDLGYRAGMTSTQRNRVRRWDRRMRQKASPK